MASLKKEKLNVHNRKKYEAEWPKSLMPLSCKIKCILKQILFSIPFDLLAFGQMFEMPSWCDLPFWMLFPLPKIFIDL